MEKTKFLEKDVFSDIDSFHECLKREEELTSLETEFIKGWNEG
jgi:hypothetical protein